MHRQRSKKDVTRQVARLETERRTLRQNAIVLETESWLHELLEEILVLARLLSPDLKSVKTVEERPNDMDLCVKLWTVQDTFKSLHFRDVEGALRHLIKVSSVILKSGPNSLIWGLDEALGRLALNSDPQDLPDYVQQGRKYVAPASRPRSPASAYANGESIDASAFSAVHPNGHSPSLDDADRGAKSCTSESLARNELSNTSPITEASDDSDDNDPDGLIDKYLSAKYELLKRSLSNKGTEQEQQSTDQEFKKLSLRIQRIERDILFDREKAKEEWDQLRKYVEVEHAKSNAVAIRQRRANEKHTSADCLAKGGELEEEELAANNDVAGEDLFGSLFAVDENKALDGEDLFGSLFAVDDTKAFGGEASPAVPIILREFEEKKDGAKPKKVLEDVCKAR